MKAPPRVERGATIAVVAPSGPVPRDRFERGAARLSAHYRLVYDERVFARTGFLAGDDDARLAELQAALDGPAAAVICARGGYGLTRILPRLDSAGFVARPKPVVAFSDGTALLAWIGALGFRAAHAPVVTQLADLGDDDVAALTALLEDPAPPPPLGGLTSLGAATSVDGRLMGGNLEMLSRLCGTALQPKLDGAILLLEDIGERPYRLDRAITQLRTSGALDGVRGVMLGDFVRCDEPPGSDDTTSRGVLVEQFGALPLLAGIPVGHGTHNRALPLGARVRLDPQSGTATLLDGLVI